MSWNYSGDPSSSDLDEVRFHVQDTDESDQLLSDEEIEYLIDAWRPIYGSLLWVASIAAEKLAAKFAREVNVSGDGTSVGVEQLQSKYEQLAVSLRDEHKARYGASGLPSAGGTLFDDYFDPSIKPLSFAKGGHDNPRAGSQDFGGTRSREVYSGEYGPW